MVDGKEMRTTPIEPPLVLPNADNAVWGHEANIVMVASAVRAPTRR